MNNYKIIYSDLDEPDCDKLKHLEEKVNKLLAQGWTCLGGVVISFSETSGRTSHIRRMYQTMVRMS
jgi:hypothetical protein